MPPTPAPASPPPFDHVAGVIERVTFRSPESGFAVLQVQVKGRRDLLAVVGTLSRETWEAVYRAAEGWPGWRARLLVMLNCCLHFDECLDTEWSDFNLDARTFCTTRNKRGRVIRAATLWPQTLAALNLIARRGPYVFTSSHGTRFNAKGQWKTWDKIRRTAKCPDAQMDDIRDGSFTAACNAKGVDEKFARLLAGHRSHGLQDHYVARNPAIVKEACEAVYEQLLRA